MLITRVELENIKSYRHTLISLRGGTTAIRGHNGSGKSTLLEAIGFALFDALNYDQAQFVREGEKYGTVTVSFISTLDDREYQAVRRCGSGAAWFIYDPELQARIAEQKVDVTDFLRKHLRLESEIQLKDLFNDAIGVPQGTFTADFLLSPANRKKKFDTLLQVEDYRKAAEKLNDTRNYLLDEQRKQEKRVDDLERETHQLDDWRADLTRLRGRERELAVYLEQLQRDAATVEARRDELRQREAEVTRLAGVAQAAEATWTAAEERLRDALARLEEAQNAVRIRSEVRGDYEAYIAAQASLSEARERSRVRDEWLRQRSTSAQQLEGATRDLSHARERLSQARAAEQRVVELFPAVTRQGELERARDEARQNLQRLEEAKRGLERAEQACREADQEIAESKRVIAALEAQRPEAEQLEERRERVSMLQSMRATRTERTKRLAAIRNEQAKATQAREKVGRDVAKAQENVRKILDNRAVAEQVPELEAEYARIEGEVRRLETRQEHHRLSREQSEGGQCPFLREPCLNIQQRGTNSLVTYFDQLIEEDEAKLAPMRERLSALHTELEHARTVRRYYDQLEQYQEKLRRDTEQLAEVNERLDQLAAERDEIEAWLAASPDESALAEAQVLFKRSDDADKQLRALAPRQAQVKLATARRETYEADAAGYRAQSEQLAATPETLRTVEAALDALGDPRHESASLEATARERPRIEQDVTQSEHAVKELQVHLAGIDEALRPFAGLDAEMQALDAELVRRQEGHTRYLQYEQVAVRLSDCEQVAKKAEQDEKAAKSGNEHAMKACAAARTSFDADALAAAIQRADDLRAERGRATEELRYTQEQSTRLADDIARVEGLLDELRAAREERQALEDVERMLQQFRDTIKEAGPNIMKALLRQISAEANRIFGEIMGDRSAQLAWESDYEIVLRRDGKDRSFAQLSGGEQMSAALAVRLALLRSLTRLDIAFFDEPTQNMDGERRGNLAEQIRRVRGFDQLIVISHDDTFEQGLDSVIHLAKRDGETVLIEEDALVSA